MARTKTMLAPKPGKEQLLIKRGNVGEALAGMKGGESRSGFLGGNIVKKPDYEVPEEVLDEAGKLRRKAIMELLMAVIEPSQLSSKSTPEMDRRSLFNKLKKSSLEELKRFLPDKMNHTPTEHLKAESLSDEQKAGIQDLYKEISP